MEQKSRLNTILLTVALVMIGTVIVLAFMIFSVMKEESDKNVVETAKKLAGELADNNLPTEAIKEYERILERGDLDDGQRGNINYLIARLYFEEIGDYEKAAAYYIRARALDENASYYDQAGMNLITSLEKMGRRLDARRELDRQASINPDTSDSPGKPVAKIGNFTITQSDFNEAFGMLPARLRDSLSTRQGKKEFLQSMVGRELIYRAALREGLDRNASIKRDLKEVEKDLLVQYYTQRKIAPDVKPDSAELELYYQAHKEEFENKPYEEVRRQVFQAYMEYLSEKAIKEYMDELIEAEPVQVFEENLK